MRDRQWWPDGGTIIVCALLSACIVVHLLPAPALAEGRPTESWETAYEDASHRYREGDLQNALARVTTARRLIEDAATDRRDALAQTLNLEAVLLDRLGRHAESEPLHRRALMLREEALHAEDPRLAESLNNLAVALDLLGRHREAEALHKRALAVREQALGPFHPDVAQSLNNLAKVQLALGRPAEAGPLLRRAIAILSRGRGQSLTRSQVDLADFAGTEHEPDEGVAHVGKVGAAMPMPGMSPPPRRVSRAPDLSLSPEPPRSDAGLLADAALHEADLAVSLLNLGMMAQTAYTGPKRDEAGPLYRRAIAIQEKVLGPEHPDLAASLNNLAELSRIQWRYREAEALHERALAIREKALGPDHPLTAASLTNLARLYSLTRRPEKAAPLLERAVAITKDALGPDHPDVALAVRSLAMTHAAVGEHGSALALHRRASRSVVSHALAFSQASDPDDGVTAQSRGRLNHHFQSHIAALHRAAAAGMEDEAVALAEAFELAQRLGDSAAARAMTQMAARVGRGQGKLAELVRERQDLAEQWRTVDRKLLAALGTLAADRDDALIRALRDELARIEEQVATISAAVESAFPEYASLAHPEPVSVQDIQRLLRKDEALVQFLIGSYGSYAWAVTTGDVRWVKLEASRRDIAQHVDALRCGLDARSWYEYGGSRCQQLLETGYHLGDYEQGKPLPFDLTRAHTLYRALFQGIEDVIRGKALLVVPSGPLTRLPLNVLVTEDRPADADRDAPGDHRSAPWLGRRQPITIVPAVTALQALRSQTLAEPPPRPFIGLGNPLLTGPDGQDRRAWGAQSCRHEDAPSLSQKIASVMQTLPLVGSLFRGSLADVRELRRQMPLPETADELCTIASQLGAADRDVWLGERATERGLKEISATGELAQYRVLHFATHGLIAGNLTGLAEPALVLTPPAEASEEDDGLLTASEVAELDLAADWVVLSACNTAAGGNGDAEALSGLARAFFHAGARALLVSHWEVSSYAAVKLSTAAFAALAEGKASGRAEAMRQAMLSLIESGVPADAHPASWAPFVVVGEGTAL